MQFRRARIALLLALGTALACASFGALASSAMAGGFPSRDSYTVNVTPATVAAGSSTTYDVALTNTSSVGRTIGAAAITPPLGFKVTGVSLGGARGQAYVLFNIVLLDRLSVAPGSTLHVSVKATAPARCNTPFNHWLTVATGGLFGELMFPDPGSNLTTKVTCASPAAGVDFATQPTNSTVGQNIPPVTVHLVDSGGNSVATSGVSVTLALSDNPGSGKLTGTLTEPTNASGVATFSDLKIDEPGVGYTLAATSGTLTGDKSDTFNESNTDTTVCDPSQTSCSTDLGTSVSDLEISADPAAGTINESVDVGQPLVCPNQRISFDANTYQFSETGTVEKFLTYELFGLNSDQITEVSICFGATYEFVNSNGGEAASGTLPDGSSGFVDLLPNCDDDFEGIGPCIDGIETFTDGHSGLEVHVEVPGAVDPTTGLPEDPAMHG